MSIAIDQGQERAPARERGDRGRATSARRWFSRRTIRAAERFRDIAWTTLATRGAAALTIVAIARAVPAEAFSPFALIAGLVWLAMVGRVALIKTADALTRRRR
ncbi:hypothetical protein DDZ18_02720 [Marinicauda salina]|jgi:hypothetical protein|uniref:Uncharacterized protein n=1 Tax=Marinicauda salina TaxID=2135793 RepID=A0A2U2BWY9_9PROT|nr:hypothetical protein [Marinicauda salina]PWE18536.1 hypothetical protein DDZ18_02720 [Marinicauda salina]